MKKNNIGLYIHVPFCVKKCAYCDFYSLSDLSLMEDYTKAICKSIKATAPIINDRKVDTLFFGGGTPSLLGIENFKIITDLISNSLDLSSDFEFSVEVNPATVSTDLANTFSSIGVNRVSIGLQSTNDDELRSLSRIHTYNDFLHTYDLIRARVTDNVNIDLMYGLPDQNLSSLESSVSDVLSLNPSHISVYGLKIEPSTPFGRMGSSLILPDDEIQSIMYHTICDMLHVNGIERYEISNFALKGRECRHNLKYWTREDYIGIGPSAYSLFDGVRYSYVRDINKYIVGSLENGSYLYDEYRALSDDDIYNESIMLGLRLEKGIVPDYETLKKADIYIKSGFMEYDSEYLRFTTNGFLVSNYILSELIR